MKKTKFLLTMLSLVLPYQTFAFERSVRGFVVYVIEILSRFLMPLLFTVALAWFIWGIVEFIRSAENSEERKKGKQRMVWGILALFFMVALIGITSIFTQSLFRVDPFLPQLHTN